MQAGGVDRSWCGGVRWSGFFVSGPNELAVGSAKVGTATPGSNAAGMTGVGDQALVATLLAALSLTLATRNAAWVP